MPTWQQAAPRQRLGQDGKRNAVENRRATPADRPAALYQPDRLAAMCGRDDLADQHGAHRPFAAEPEPLQRAKHEDLLEVLREADRERADREPQDRALQYLDPSVAIREDAGNPAAHRRENQRHGAQQAGLAAIEAPQVDQRSQHEAEHHEVERIGRSAGERRLERALAGGIEFRVPGRAGSGSERDFLGISCWRHRVVR